MNLNVIKIRNIKELSEYLAMKNGMIIAGGTDVIVKARKGFIKRINLFDISSLQGLRYIRETKKGFSIGALTTHAYIASSKLLEKEAPALVQAAKEVGSPQIRNLGTIGGNLANASPSGDLIPPLYTLKAKIVIVSKAGTRVVSISDFFKGPGKTVLKESEYIKEIKISKCVGAFLRLTQRNSLAISKTSVAISGTIKEKVFMDIRVALGAVGPTIILAEKAASFIKGKKINSAIIKEFEKIVSNEARPISDIRSTAEYRKETTGVLAGRVLKSLI